MTANTRKSKQELAGDIAGRLMRRHSTAVVLFHHAVAERLGLGSTDHKCFDLLREREPLTGSELARITGLTTGAVTGVVARLERAGFVHREPDPRDGRKQTIHPAGERAQDLRSVFEPLHADMAELLARFDKPQLATIAEFLELGTELVQRHAVLLRSHRFTGDDK